MPLGDVTTIERYSAYPAVFDTLEIPDIVDTDTQFNINEIDEPAAGSVDVNASAVGNLDPSIMLTCLNLAHLATISPTVGLAVAGDGALIQHQRRADGGVWDSSGHLLFLSTKGFLLPMSIEASHASNQAARMQLKYWALYDGTNNALQILTDDLTSASGPLIGAMFRLAKTTVNSNLVAGNQSTKIDFGLDYQTTGQNGELWPREGSIHGRKPSITIEPKNLQGFLAITGGSRVKLAGNVVCYFKKEGVANGTAEHISVTLTTPSCKVVNVQANRNDDPKPAVMFQATGGGTIAIATNATIS